MLNLLFDLALKLTKYRTLPSPTTAHHGARGVAVGRRQVEGRMSARVVVAGASGNVGSAAVHKLSQMGVEVKALTRSSASEKCAPLKALANVELVECDISDQSSLSGVFDGVKAAFLTCGNFRGQVKAEIAFIDAAVAAGCPYLVKLGTVRSYTAMDSVSEYARFHAEVEAHLEKAAGAMKYVVLCPNWFFSNHLGDIFGTLPMSIIAYPHAPEAKATGVDPRDVGEVAAQMMMADPSAYHGLKLDIAGPEAQSISQIAALYTAALGTPARRDARSCRSTWAAPRRGAC